jgi:hypothetical protein
VDVGHQKTRRKTLGLCNLKIEIELSTAEKSITHLEVAIQVRGDVGCEAKTDLCIACIMREI